MIEERSLLESFRVPTEAVGAEVHRVGCRDEALGFILDFLRAVGIADAPCAYAVWADSSFLNGLDRNLLTREVPGLSFAVTRELAAVSKVGISEMDWALADTGTLVRPRGISHNGHVARGGWRESCRVSVGSEEAAVGLKSQILSKRNRQFKRARNIGKQGGMHETPATETKANRYWTGETGGVV